VGVAVDVDESVVVSDSPFVTSDGALKDHLSSLLERSASAPGEAALASGSHDFAGSAWAIIDRNRSRSSGSGLVDVRSHESHGLTRRGRRPLQRTGEAGSLSSAPVFQRRITCFESSDVDAHGPGHAHGHGHDHGVFVGLTSAAR